MSVPFLLNYTKPGSNVLTDLFGPAQSTPDMNSDLPELAPIFPGGLDYICHGSASSFLDETFYDGELELSLAHPPTIRDARLEDRLTDMVSQLTKVHQSLSARKRASIQPLDPELRTTLFTVPNLVEFIDLFFLNWPSECQILHRPTFEADTVATPILLAVFLVGAIYSFPRDTASMARECFDMAEESVFQHEEFTSMLQKEERVLALTKNRVEILQAAIIIETVHHSNFKSLAGRRMRVHHFSQIVAATRLVRLFSAKNDYISRGNDLLGLFDWNAYIEEESKVRYANPFSPCCLGELIVRPRLKWGIYLADCNYTIFKWCSPQIMISEIDGDFPSSQDAWNAPDSLACEKAMIEAQKLPRFHLSSCVQSLMLDSWNAEGSAQLETLTINGLFCLING
jgi:hypothetical protein